VKNISIKIIFKWLLLALTIGALSGIIGFAFYKSITFVTSVRSNYSFIILLLPIAALASVALNRALKTSKIGTNSIINSVNDESKIKWTVLPAIFLSSVITHLFGGSAGREGAALQMGGGGASIVSKRFKLKDDESRILTVCGMAAFFSALFGTPIGAAIFALEVSFNKSICKKACLPTLISSCVAYYISTALGTNPERFNIVNFSYNLSLILNILLIAIVVGIVGALFCGGLKLCHKYLKRVINNDYLLIFVGSLIIVLLTYLVGNQDYNGSGNYLIEQAFNHSKVNWYDFLLKAVFTIITVSVGLKGGEIVPSLSIGATLGGVLALCFGLDITVGAVIGMAAIFNSVTKCPFATLLICSEMFGISSVPLCALSIIISIAFSSKTGLYEHKQNKASLLCIFKSLKR